VRSAGGTSPAALAADWLSGRIVCPGGAGQSRLNAASSEVYQSQLRLQALGEFAALVTDAETGQRGYLLTGNDAYLEPYRAATPKIDSALDRLRRSTCSRQAPRRCASCEF